MNVIINIMNKLLLLLVLIVPLSVANAAISPSQTNSSPDPYASSFQIIEPPTNNVPIPQKAPRPDTSQESNERVDILCNDKKDKARAQIVFPVGTGKTEAYIEAKCCKKSSAGAYSCSNDLKDATHIAAKVRLPQSKGWVDVFKSKLGIGDKSTVFIEKGAACELSKKVLTFFLVSEGDSIKFRCGEQDNSDAAKQKRIDDIGKGETEEERRRREEIERYNKDVERRNAEAKAYNDANQRAEDQARAAQQQQASQNTNYDPQSYGGEAYDPFGEDGAYSYQESRDDYLDSLDDSALGDGDLSEFEEFDWDEDEFGDSDWLGDDRASADEQYDPFFGGQYEDGDEVQVQDNYAEFYYEDYDELDNPIFGFLGSDIGALDSDYLQDGGVEYFDFSEDYAEIERKYPGWESDFEYFSFAEMQLAYPTMSQDDYDIMKAIFAHNTASWALNLEGEYLPGEAQQETRGVLYKIFVGWYWDPIREYFNPTYSI